MPMGISAHIRAQANDIALAGRGDAEFEFLDEARDCGKLLDFLAGYVVKGAARAMSHRLRSPCLTA